MPTTTREIAIRRTTTPKPRVAASALGFGRYFTDHMFVMDWSEAAGWHEPRVVPYGTNALEPAASCFHYGQTMFEGMKAFRQRDGRVVLFRPERHCRRMAEGAPRLCMPAPDPAELQEAIATVVRTDADWVPEAPGTALYIRPTLVATEAFLGVRPAKHYKLFIILSPVGSYYPEGLNPVKLAVEERYVRAAPGGLGWTKAGANYAASLLAAEEARRRGFSQVLWLDALSHQFCEEAGVMNLFVKIGDEVLTPPLNGTILGGVTRDSALTLLREWGVPVHERAPSIEELLAARRGGKLAEVFGTGTAAVVSPVGELGYRDERIVVNDGRIGPLSKRLYEAITAIQYGETSDTHGWIVPV